MKFFENKIGGPGDTQARGRATSGDENDAIPGGSIFWFFDKKTGAGKSNAHTRPWEYLESTGLPLEGSGPINRLPDLPCL